MRRFAIVISGLLACEHGKGGGSIVMDAPSGFVEELSMTSQVELCSQFVDQICANGTDPDLDGFCADACVTARNTDGTLTVCTNAAQTAGIETECAGIPVAAVQDCFTTANLDICQQDGGGCIFDAIDAQCAPL